MQPGMLHDSELCIIYSSVSQPFIQWSMFYISWHSRSGISTHLVAKIDLKINKSDNCLLPLTLINGTLVCHHGWEPLIYSIREPESKLSHRERPPISCPIFHWFLRFSSKWIPWFHPCLKLILFQIITDRVIIFQPIVLLITLKTACVQRPPYGHKRAVVDGRLQLMIKELKMEPQNGGRCVQVIVNSCSTVLAYKQKIHCDTSFVKWIQGQSRIIMS